VIQHNGVHSHEHPITKRRAMDNGIMSDSTFLTHSQRRIFVEVKRAVILNVRAATDDDGAGISADDCVIPDTHSFVNGDITDNHRIRANKYVFRNSAPLAFE